MRALACDMLNSSGRPTLYCSRRTTRRSTPLCLLMAQRGMSLLSANLVPAAACVYADMLKYD
jgi:hypothetical protein